MNWELTLLLGFLLLFGAWVSFPITDHYFFIDSHGVKHHILTPEISDHNTADNLTNILFTRYENPWMEYAGTNIIFVAGIFIILQQEPVRLYLRNRTWALVPVNLEKHLHGHLQNKSKVFNLGYGKRNNDLARWQLIFFTTKRLKKSSKVFVFFSLLILFSFYTQNAYAATAEFVDGNQFTGLSTNCASRSTVATLNTSLPAASSSTPNIIIATTDYVSSDGGNEQVQTSSGVYLSGSQLVGSQYSFFIANPNEGNHYTYLYEDSTAGASPTYTVEGCLSATGGNAESKILAIQGLESSFIDSGNVGTTAGSFVTITTLSTDLTANDHIIIAQVQIDFDGTATIAAGDVELRNNADTMLAENEFEIRGASGAIGDGSAITLIAVVNAGSANTSYKVAVREPAGGGVADAEAKILAIKPNGGEKYFSDGGSVSVANSATQLTSLTSSFSNDENIVVMSASQFDDTDTASENLDITSGHEIREDSVAKSGNQMAIGELAASGNAGEGIRHTLIWFGSVASTSLGYESRADASATGYNGESKLLAFSIQERLFPSDTPSLSDNALVNQNLFPSDTPTLSDSGVIDLSGTRSGTDIPLLFDIGTIRLSVVAGIDTPSITDSASILKFKKRGGGSSNDMEPPSFVGRLPAAGEFGAIITTNNLNLPLHSETVPTTIIKTGEETQLKLLIFDNSGLSAIQHVAVYTNLRETTRDVENSDAYMVYEKGNIPLQITDPNGLFSNVGLKISPKDKELELTFYITFAKPMDKSDIIFRLWDVYRNSQDIKILDALQVIESSNDIAGGLNNTASDNISPLDLIKAWRGHSSSSISDTDLLKYFGIEAGHVPSWFKKNYPQWVISEQVSLQEFIDAIEYMYKQKIIH